MTPAALLSRVRAKKPPPPAPAQASVTVDDRSSAPDMMALEAELEAALAAAQNGDEWTGRDPAVIMGELRIAKKTARVAADLSDNAKVTRKEFEEFQVAAAIAFIGIEAALRDQSVSPRSIPNFISANAAAMGISRPQEKALDDFLRKVDSVKRQYSNWDRETASARAAAAREAALRRPPPR